MFHRGVRAANLACGTSKTYALYLRRLMLELDRWDEEKTSTNIG